MPLAPHEAGPITAYSARRARGAPDVTTLKVPALHAVFVPAAHEEVGDRAVKKCRPGGSLQQGLVSTIESEEKGQEQQEAVRIRCTWHLATPQHCQSPPFQDHAQLVRQAPGPLRPSLFAGSRLA